MSNRIQIVGLVLAFTFLASGTSLAKRKTKTVQYGPHARHRVKVQFDKAGEPQAINVHFHGGGFKAGAPTFGPLAKQFRSNNMSLAGATYRFIEDGVTKREIFNDGARVIQFLRLNAEQYNIDPDRISVSGYSAGGVMAAWIALHDDIADVFHSDPVLQESSRVSACWIYKSQVHPLYLADWIQYSDWDPASLMSGIIAFVEQRLSGDQFVQPFHEHDFDDPAEYDAAMDEYTLDTFPFYLASSDDPPIGFMEKKTDDITAYLVKILPHKWGNLLHSPALMVPLQRRLEDLNVDVLWGKKAQVQQFILNALGA